MSPFIEKTIQQHRRAPGFTLVELLTVIAIIAVLAAITLPIIRTARVSAFTAADMGRLRAIAAGFSLFASDNNGRYPSNGVGSSQSSGARDTRWMSHVGRYMGIGNDRSLTITINGVPLTYLVLTNAYRRAEFHSAFTPSELYDWDNATHESLGIFGANSRLLTNNDGWGRFGILVEEVSFPSKTILLGERYAGVLGDGAGLPTAGPTVDRTGLFPGKPQGLASNAEVMRRGAYVGQGPVSLLMADFSVQQVNLEDLKGDTMDRTNSTGIRYYP